MWLNFDKSPSMLPQQPVPVQQLSHSSWEEKGIELYLLRLDQIHSAVSGNKFFKLKYNLEEVRKQGKNTLLTFGGAFSNHIYATAAAAHSAGLRSIGVIRGQELEAKNPTLSFAKKMGMQLHFVDRERYRIKHSPEFERDLIHRFGDFYLIPEGGTNPLAIRGTREILDESHAEYSHVCVSIGTGGTFAGLAGTIGPHQQLIGFSSLKGEFILREVSDLMLSLGVNSLGKLEIKTDYHFGGYGKYKAELIEFMNWFYSEFQVPLDPIYTGKMALGVFDLVRKNHFPKGSKILMIHTGGLQGNAGFQEKTGIFLPIL